MQRCITDVECMWNSCKKHQFVDRWAEDKISVSQILFWNYVEYVRLILRNYKKLKRAKIVRFTIFSFLSAHNFLVTAAP